MWYVLQALPQIVHLWGFYGNYTNWMSHLLGKFIARLIFFLFMNVNVYLFLFWLLITQVFLFLSLTQILNLADFKQLFFIFSLLHSFF